MVTETKKFESIPISQVEEIAAGNDYQRSKLINFTDNNVKIGNEGETFILTNKTKEYIVSPLAMKNVVQSLELPVAMVKKLETYPDLLSHNIDYMIKHKGLSRKALIKGKQVVAFADINATLVRNEQVIKALKTNLEPLIVDKVDVSPDGTLRINAVQEDSKLIMSKGDVFRSGVFLRNNPYGIMKTSIEGYLARSICLNGQIDGATVFTAPKVIDAPIPSWLNANIKRAKIVGEGLFTSIKELKSKTIDVDVAEFMEGVFLDLQIPINVQAHILNRILKYGAENMYDVMNAITYVASHYRDVLDDPGLSDRLMRAGGHFAQHVSETCNNCHRAVVSVN